MFVPEFAKEQGAAFAPSDGGFDSMAFDFEGTLLRGILDVLGGRWPYFFLPPPCVFQTSLHFMLKFVNFR